MPYDKDRWRASVQNGKIPRSKLAEVIPRIHDDDLNGPVIMHPEAAAAMSALLQDAPSELTIRFSYRTYAKQQEKWANYIGPDGIQGTSDDGTLAAYPGTSNHGWAVAVDFTGLSPRALTWLRVHAKEYGYVNDVPSENWHWVYYGGWKRPKKGYKFRGKVYRSRTFAARALRKSLADAKFGAERTVKVVER